MIMYALFWWCFRLVLRILPPANFKVQCQLGNKFGCLPEDAHTLLEKAKQLELNVVGVR
jgi:diaminopimelate decarboxylase